MLNPSSPFFVELTLWTVYVLLAASLALTLWSVVRSMGLRGRGQADDNGVPATRIAWVVGGVLVVLLAVTYALGGTEPLAINGKPFADAFWLRTSDMLINSSLVLMALATIAVLAGFLGIGRHIK